MLEKDISKWKLNLLATLKNTVSLLSSSPAQIRSFLFFFKCIFNLSLHILTSFRVCPFNCFHCFWTVVLKFIKKHHSNNLLTGVQQAVGWVSSVNATSLWVVSAALQQQRRAASSLCAKGAWRLSPLISFWYYQCWEFSRNPIRNYGSHVN